MLKKIVFISALLGVWGILPSCNTIRCVPVVKYLIPGGETTFEKMNGKTMRIPCSWKLSKKYRDINPGITTFPEIRIYRYKTPEYIEFKKEVCGIYDLNDWDMYLVFWPGGQFLTIEKSTSSEILLCKSERMLKFKKARENHLIPGIYRLLPDGKIITEYSYTIPHPFFRRGNGFYDIDKIHLKIEKRHLYTERDVIMERVFNTDVDFSPIW